MKITLRLLWWLFLVNKSQRQRAPLEGGLAHEIVDYDDFGSWIIGEIRRLRQAFAKFQRATELSNSGLPFRV
ncbi:unnamed protein product [Trichogramma brassicae]|uniref:Uncharacterized protein n=1 Tax=Trichogramma brassicae TaxID=86971 RepID=A0A6H5HT21_9HYME|nr:unnamed protein product [Trichogramma brassicae]